MKKIIIILLVVIIGLLVYIAFKPKQTVAPVEQVVNSNNQNTNNNQPVQPSTNYVGNGFTVNYPATHSFEDNVTYRATLGADAVNFITGDPYNPASELGAQYVVFIKNDISTNQALATYTKDLIKNNNGDQNVPLTEKAVTVAGRNGIQYTYQPIAGGNNGTRYVTAVVHDQKAYIITMADATLADYMKFVSSFTFN